MPRMAQTSPNSMSETARSQLGLGLRVSLAKTCYLLKRSLQNAPSHFVGAKVGLFEQHREG